MIRNFLSAIILLTAISAFGCVHKSTITMDEIRHTDLSKVILPDTILVEFEYDSEKKEYIFNEKAFEQRWFEPIGYRGSDFQRLYIHYDTVYHKGNGRYAVEGRTRYRDTIRFFSGTITLDSLRMWTDEYLPESGEFGELYGHYLFYEDEFSGGGTFSGNMRIGFAKVNGRFYYDAFNIIADGYENRQYEGTWTAKNLQTEKCNWGDFRIPDSRDLDMGAGEFSPAEEYLDKGWKIHTFSWQDNDSLWNLYKADEQWFTHEGDYVIPYSGKMQRFVKACDRNPKPETKYVLAAIPATQEEFSIWYEMAEIPQDTSYQKLWTLASEYAGDSTDVMFAYMRMGEFSDGYVSEGLFDDYVRLKDRYPALFAKYRKQLSHTWNEVFDEWEKIVKEY